ncbi:MAG: hypothetical protein GY854_11070 [Deltaproteobacteria bacterium]|nr:hypothetical protein [Deltaproteobacteria bacterium]
MTQEFVFAGNPGPNAAAMLKTLHDSGLSPRRLAVSKNLPGEIAQGSPGIIMFGSDVKELGQIVQQVREERTLASVPVLACVSSLDSDLLNEAFRSGMDDYLVTGVHEQFEALVAILQKEDTWRVVRAPAGQVILADSDRLERVRFGRILRRNGFDTFFAGSIDELREATKLGNARVVIAANTLPGGSLMELIEEIGQRDSESLPWIVVATSEEIDSFPSNFQENANTAVFETGADAEGLTFVMNELLAPPPAGVRKSPRILYGTPATYLHHGGKVPFYGFTYNVNIGGLYIRTLTPLPLQTHIEVTFTPPFGRGQVVANAQVVWCKQLGNAAGAASPPGMGIQFLHMEPADKAGFEAGYMILLEKNREIQGNSMDPSPCA